VFAYAVGVSVLTAVLFGLFPALRLARVELHEALKQGSAKVKPAGITPTTVMGDPLIRIRRPNTPRSPP
jgi:hypothetical protein